MWINAIAFFYFKRPHLNSKSESKNARNTNYKINLYGCELLLFLPNLGDNWTQSRDTSNLYQSFIYHNHFLKKKIFRFFLKLQRKKQSNELFPMPGLLLGPLLKKYFITRTPFFHTFYLWNSYIVSLSSIRLVLSTLSASILIL